jgi:hypothetical protein
MEMKIQREDYSRDVFLSVFGIDANAWGQRAYREEVALAFGMKKPVFQNQYGEIDLFATALTFYIAFFFKIDMKRAAGLVRDTWREWLEGLAKVERMKFHRTIEGICFVLACSSDKTKIEAAVGPCEEVIDEVTRAGMVPFPLPLDFVVKELRKGAKKAGVRLPKTLTPAAFGSNEYQRWIADIENYRRVAASRRNTRKMAKAAA